MKAKDVVREIMNVRGVRFVDLRKRLGIESNTMSNRLKQENISVAKLNEMLRVLDYKLVVVPNGTRLSADEYEVE